MFSKKPEKGSGTIEIAKSSPPAMASMAPATQQVSAASSSEAKSQKEGTPVVPSLIGTDLTITGNVISKGEVQVDGEIQGDIHCASLVVGESAQITGGIVAEDVVVRGRVNGSIRATRVTMEASSHVEGDVYHKTLAIEQGAFFEGKSRRAEDPVAAAATTKSQKPESASESPSATGGMVPPPGNGKIPASGS